MENHTALPWTNMPVPNGIDKVGLVILGADGIGVGSAWSDKRPEAQANAAFITTSANYHYKLIHQLKKAVHQIRMRKKRTAKEDETIATAEKLLAELGD